MRPSAWLTRFRLRRRFPLVVVPPSPPFNARCERCIPGGVAPLLCQDIGDALAAGAGRVGAGDSANVLDPTRGDITLSSPWERPFRLPGDCLAALW